MQTRQINRILDAEPVASLRDYVQTGGGSGLAAARDRRPAEVVDIIEASGLRGRGGAGFPTGRKWRTVAATGASLGPPLVVVNAAEGEPGTFKDRLLIRRNPYRVLEGACAAAHALGSHRIAIATKASFRREIDRLNDAVREVRDAGWFDGELQIVQGPSEYLYGEETALLEVIEHRAPFPRVAPPYRRGVTGAVALVNNVETFANVAEICRHGSEWFRSAGTDESPGTVIFTVTGDCPQHGCGEFAMGTPLRAVLEALGGVTGGVGAVLPGVSNPPLGPEALEVPLSHEALRARGSGLGSGTLIVIAEETDLRSMAAEVARFLSTESCGQCEPCKRDGLAIAATLRTGSVGDAADRLRTVARGARCALAGQTERVVGGLLALAENQRRPRSSLRPVPPGAIAPMVDIVSGRALLDEGHVHKRPDWTHEPERDSGLWPVLRLTHHRLEVDTAATTEPPPPAAGGAAPTSRRGADPFAALRAHDAELERRCDVLRRAPVAELEPALRSVREQLERHMRATQDLVYPLASRHDPEIGDDVTWYPAHHERTALQLIEQLESRQGSPRQIDEICASIHLANRELAERILPLLEHDLEGQPHDVVEIGGDVTELLSP